MTSALNDSRLAALHGGVRSVAFGEGFDSYFLVFNDGWWDHDGDIPHGLRRVMDSRSWRADLTCVSLGPGGEWFLRAENGRFESPAAVERKRHA